MPNSFVISVPPSRAGQSWSAVIRSAISTIAWDRIELRPAMTAETSVGSQTGPSWSATPWPMNRETVIPLWR